MDKDDDQLHPADSEQAPSTWRPGCGEVMLALGAFVGIVCVVLFAVLPVLANDWITDWASLLVAFTSAGILGLVFVIAGILIVAGIVTVVWRGRS